MKEFLEQRLVRFLEELDAEVLYQEIEKIVVDELKATLNEMVKNGELKFRREDGEIYFML